MAAKGAAIFAGDQGIDHLIALQTQDALQRGIQPAGLPRDALRLIADGGDARIGHQRAERCVLQRRDVLRLVDDELAQLVVALRAEHAGLQIEKRARRREVERLLLRIAGIAAPERAEAFRYGDAARKLREKGVVAHQADEQRLRTHPELPLDALTRAGEIADGQTAGVAFGIGAGDVGREQHRDVAGAGVLPPL